MRSILFMPILFSLCLSPWGGAAAVAQSPSPLVVKEPTVIAPADKHEAPSRIGGRYLNQVMLASPQHKKTVADLLRGRRGIPNWARNLANAGQYVAGVSREIKLPEGEFELFGACEPRLCTTSRLRILFTPDGSRAWFWLTDAKTGDVTLGMPSAAQMQILQEPGI